MSKNNQGPQTISSQIDSLSAFMRKQINQKCQEEEKSNKKKLKKQDEDQEDQEKKAKELKAAMQESKALASRIEKLGMYKRLLTETFMAYFAVLLLSITFFFVLIKAGPALVYLFNTLMGYFIMSALNLN